MSALPKVKTVLEYIATQIDALPAYDNFNITYGENVEVNERPSARVFVQNIDTIFEGQVIYFSTAQIVVGIEVLYQPLLTFMDNLSDFVDQLNGSGTIDCGVEFLHVANTTFSEEDKKYSRAVFVIEASFYHE